MERGKKKKLQQAERARRLLLTMGQNRSFLNKKVDFILIKKKFSTYKLGFNSLSIERVNAFTFAIQ